MTRPLAVVLNPQAGGGSARRAWPALERELTRRGLSFERIEEKSGDAALTRVLALPPDVAVLAVGGDGTVGALLPAVVGTGRPLGIVPLVVVDRLWAERWRRRVQPAEPDRTVSQPG